MCVKTLWLEGAVSRVGSDADVTEKQLVDTRQFQPQLQTNGAADSCHTTSLLRAGTALEGSRFRVTLEH